VTKPAILLSPRFYHSLKNISDAELGRVEEALRIIPDCFGQPHVHTGISIRRLRKNIFECRAGLKIRLLFRQKPGALEFFFVGDHDEVRHIIRGF
jgi:hypothetical protein